MTPSVESSSRTVGVVAHPKKVDDKLRGQLEKAATKAGFDTVLWFETSEHDPGQGPAREALRAGVELILALGGDGTVRAIAEAMRGSEVPLGIIPLGTGNLFAHNLDPGIRGITPVVLTVAQAIRIVFGGVDRRVDVGLIDIEWPDGSDSEHAFLVLAGVGIDAQMIANTRAAEKKRVGVLAYVAGIARSMRAQHSIRVRIMIDDQPLRVSSVHSVLVGNCGMLPGNIAMLPAAEIDDGLLDVVTLRPKGFFGWIRVWRAMFFEHNLLGRSRAGRRQLVSGKRRIRVVRYEQARHIKVSWDEPDDIELDGEHFGQATGFTVRVDPGALIVRVAETSRFSRGAVSLGATTPAHSKGSRAANPAPR